MPKESCRVRGSPRNSQSGRHAAARTVLRRSTSLGVCVLLVDGVLVGAFVGLWVGALVGAACVGPLVGLENVVSSFRCVAPIDIEWYCCCYEQSETSQEGGRINKADNIEIIVVNKREGRIRTISVPRSNPSIGCMCCAPSKTYRY